MKKREIFILSLFLCLLISSNIKAQLPEGAKSLSTNIRANDYPYVLPDLRVIFKVNAPDAAKVQIDLMKIYDMQKDEKGVWTVTTDPQEPGFHYYSLVIDGVKIADPASETFYGMGRMASAVDIPEKGVDFYTIKDVNHGVIRSETYFSNVTKSWRNLNVYTPPDYDKDREENYPVLYIQHGGGEDERGWATQGKTNVILDNLIAEGKAVPMIVVMANGNAARPGENFRGYTEEAMDAFREEILENVIPFVENRYRTKPGSGNRAMSGLSMGGGQSFYTGLRNLDVFANVGIFSSGLFGGIPQSGKSFNPEDIIPGILTDSDSFNKKLKVFYLSVGEQDPRIEPTKKLVENFQNSGLNVEFNSFPGGHEWQVWRKSLHDFAQKLFK